jgi:catechol 2,3-dioxygenase-like lactoylglutathione lyase family enzyme
MTSTVRGLRQVGQHVEDLDRAVAFYRDVLGLELVARYGPLAFFDLGGVRLLLEAGAGGAGTSPLYLDVADVQAVRHELEGRGVAFDGEAHVVFADVDGIFGAPGEDEWLTFFHDTEGNLLALSARQRPAVPPAAPA